MFLLLKPLSHKFLMALVLASGDLNTHTYVGSRKRRGGKTKICVPEYAPSDT